MIGVRIIFTTNELVDTTRHFKSSASQLNTKIQEKNTPQTRFFVKQNAPQARLMQQNAPQARFLELVIMGTLSY